LIANCKECGALFNQILHNICPACVQEEQKRFEIVQKYLKENRYATIVDIVRHTQILIEEVTIMIERGKLMLVDFPNLSIECKGCGLPTQEGVYCNECKNDLIMELADATENVRKLRANQAVPTGVRFHTK
jgi:flagellar operon protein (TIGR03826 family)